MKKKILFLAAALMVLKLPMFASADGGDPKKMVANSNNATINLTMPYPTLAFENGIEGFVLVEVSQTEDGKFTVLQVNGSNPLLIEGVLQYLNENSPTTNNKEDIVVYQFYFNIY
jgi:hypothetical protein